MVKKKIGNHFYNYSGSYPSTERAEKARDQFRAFGIPAEIIKEAKETEYAPYKPVEGYSVYSWTPYRRKSREREKPFY